MKELNYLLIIIALNFIITQASFGDQKCQSFKTRSMYLKKYIYQNLELCPGYDSKFKLKYFVSKSCLNNQCKPLHPKTIVFLEPSNYGSPASRLCSKLKGEPKEYEILIDNEWKSEALCFFKSKDIVSTFYLYGQKQR